LPQIDKRPSQLSATEWLDLKANALLQDPAKNSKVFNIEKIHTHRQALVEHLRSLANTRSWDKLQEILSQINLKQKILRRLVLNSIRSVFAAAVDSNL